jgi:SNF2 family DNA or RNA helicase
MSLIMQIVREVKLKNDKILIFTNLRATFDAIKAMLEENKIEWAGFAGDDEGKVRNEQVEKFQAKNSSNTVFLATMRVRLALLRFAKTKIILKKPKKQKKTRREPNISETD